MPWKDCAALPIQEFGGYSKGIDFGKTQDPPHTDLSWT